MRKPTHRPTGRIRVPLAPLIGSDEMSGADKRLELIPASYFVLASIALSSFQG